MAANETIEIPTHFDASSIGAQEQTQQPGCTEFEPLVDTKGIERISHWLDTRTTSHGQNGVRIAEAILGSDKLPRVMGPTMHVIPEIETIRQEIALMALAAGYDPIRGIILTSYSIYRPNGFPTVFKWHKDAYDHFLDEDLESIQTAALFYSPDEPGTEALSNDSLGIVYDATTDQPHNDPSPQQQKAGLRVAAQAFQDQAPSTQGAKGNVFGFDLTRQPWHRSPQGRTRLFMFQIVDSVGVNDPPILY